MEHLSNRSKALLSGVVLLLGMIAAVFYSVNIDDADPVNPLTQSRVVMQGHSLLQIEDNWYEVG